MILNVYVNTVINNMTILHINAKKLIWQEENVAVAENLDAIICVKFVVNHMISIKLFLKIEKIE